MVRLLLGVFGSVFHDLNEFLKLLPCPEQHLIGVFLTHTSRFVAWILFQSIVLDCVVENCRKLVVDALEIGLRVRLAAFIAVAGQRVLPLAHMGRLDLVQRDFLEEGCHLQVDQPFLLATVEGLRRCSISLTYNSMKSPKFMPRLPVDWLMMSRSH